MWPLPKAFREQCFTMLAWFFCIRGGQEQRNLGQSKLRFVSNSYSDPNCVFYKKHGKKSHPGGLKDLRVENRSVPCYTVTEIFQIVLCLFTWNGSPDMHFLKTFCIFGLRKSVQLIHRALGMKIVLLERIAYQIWWRKWVSIAKKTNHSLCATGASAMFQAEVL